MEFITLLTLFAVGIHLANGHQQRQRIALLGSYLAKYRIENLMENLMQGYLRALGEADAQRQASIWSMLDTAELELCGQVNAFVLDFAKVDEPLARVSKLSLALPYATQWVAGTFDLRKVFGVHAKALEQVAQNRQQRTPKDKAFTLMAELMLLQHSCHWFCRSKTVASARLLMRHQTHYAQVLDAVAPSTRNAYVALVGMPA